MTIAVAADVTRGQTTLEGVRFRAPQTGKTARIFTGRFICIPYQNRLVSSGSASAVHVIPATQANIRESWNGQHIYPIPSKGRVYDLGWRDNWRRVLGQSLFEDGAPCQG
jgi:hypothetical protein